MSGICEEELKKLAGATQCDYERGLHNPCQLVGTGHI